MSLNTDRKHISCRRISTGRPLGNAYFIAGIERLLGRLVTRRAPERKPAQAGGAQLNLL